MIFWKMAMRNLKRHFRRSLTTGLAIAFGFAGVVLLGGYMLRMDGYLATQAIYLNHVGHISVYKKDALDQMLANPERYSLTPEEQEIIRTTAGTLPLKPEWIAASLTAQGLITTGCTSVPFLATGVDPHLEAKIREAPEVLRRIPELNRLLKGRDFWHSGDQKDFILITQRMASVLGKPLVAGEAGEDPKAMTYNISDCTDPSAQSLIRSHSAVQLLGSTYAGGVAAADARVSGHFTTGLSLTDETATVMPLELLQNFLQTDRVSSMALYFDPLQVDVKKVMAQLQTAFADQNQNFDLYSYDDERVSPFYVGAMNFVFVMTAFFVFTVCGVVALSILNSLKIALYERRSEIGTLRSIGFQPNQVTGLMLRETLLLSLGSLFCGGWIAWGVAEIVNGMNIRFAIVGSAGDLQFILKPGLLFSFEIGLLFASAAMLTCWLTCRSYLRISIVNLLETT
jgi:putative ABC transport system permease protein